MYKCVFLLSNKMLDLINQFTSLPVKNIILLHSTNAFFILYSRGGVLYQCSTHVSKNVPFETLRHGPKGSAKDYGANPLEFNPRRLPRSKDSSQMKHILRSILFPIAWCYLYHYYLLDQCATFFLSDFSSYYF